MPELPEVETIRSILEPIIKGGLIEKVEVFYSRMIISPLNEFKENIKGHSFTSIGRMGKFLLFYLDNGLVIISHLRMEGKFYILTKNEQLTKYARMAFFLKDGRIICYDDSRRFGIMYLTTTENLFKVPQIQKLGAEPFNIVNIEPVFKKFTSSYRPIKELLLDQTIIAGLGNIYADEVLYRCQIHPEFPGHYLTKTQTKNLVEQAKIVLTLAIKAGGSTIRTYHAARGVDGNFQTELLAYSHQGKPCSRCGTLLVKIQVKGRGSTYCPKCQKNFTFPIIVGVTGPMASGKSLLLEQARIRNYEIIKTDEIVRRLYQQTQIIADVNKLLKGGFIINDLLDTSAIMKKIAFDPVSKKRLEKYIHPLVRKEVETDISKSTKPFIFVEVPLLFESGFDSFCDFTIGIVISPTRQLENIKIRNPEHYEEYKALAKTKINIDLSTRVDYLISNNGSIKQFEELINTAINEMELIVNKGRGRLQ